MIQYFSFKFNNLLPDFDGSAQLFWNSKIMIVYPHLILLFTLGNPELKVQPSKQRTQQELLGDILGDSLLYWY
jgi:hypothetical protein